MSEFFLELFSEEIPAGLQKNLREKIFEDFKNLFEEKSIKSKKNFSFSTPNRLVLVFEGLSKQIKILLASTLAEVKTRGSFATEIQVDSNSLQKLFDQVEFKRESILKLDTISTNNSDTADKISVKFRVTKQPI